ncbi:DEAD-box ATP-dependent RNA helicase 57-like [Phalaenopsis equestris]|uniref:DEAD-box ATP-dependent RNA helicase 57-like n=1 Tax=Phalaenopsis equestris TaxID=78828 RepID=UPI0009E33B36|nr:DEAD-box ATP-dependent RNA helicase 57-like [Phalaenopsis equestris]
MDKFISACADYLQDQYFRWRTGRSGRARRCGQAITFFTEEDKLFLRNIANVMKESGCEVPDWILCLPKLKRKKHRPMRDSVGAEPVDTEDH